MIRKLLFVSIVSLALASCSTRNILNYESIRVSNSSSALSTTGASLKVEINFDKKFQTKASSNGIPAKTVNDVHSVKVYLTSSNGSNPLVTGNLKYTSPILVYTAGSNSVTYTFSNVPAGTYYAAVELFEDTIGNNTMNIIEPITYTSSAVGDTAFGFTGGKRGLTISANSATVSAPAMTFSYSDSSTSFKIIPILKNAVGANLAVDVNPQSGTPPSTILGAF